jgi:hypothetical protein
MSPERAAQLTLPNQEFISTTAMAQQRSQNDYGHPDMGKS